MDISSRKLLSKAKREQRITRRLTIGGLSLSLIQLSFMIFGVNHQYENEVLWGLLLVIFLVNSEIFGTTKSQLIAELEKAVNDSPESFEMAAHNKPF